MIDAENAIYTEVRNYLKENFKSIEVAAEYVDTPTKFPHVAIYFANNSTYERCNDSSGLENAVSVIIETNIYSNKQTARKAECKKIAEAVNTKLNRLGFNRISMQPVTNYADSSIARWVLRHEGVIDRNNLIYRR